MEYDNEADKISQNLIVKIHLNVIISFSKAIYRVCCLHRSIDNEWGYSNKVLELIGHMSKVDNA